MQARRIAFTAPAKATDEQFELPEPDDDEVLVQALYTCISPGTERAHLLAQPNTMTRDRGFPFYPGYSSIGQILRVGPAVKGYGVGQRVATSVPHVSHALIAPAAPDIGLRAVRKLGIAADASFAAAADIAALPADLSEEQLKECATYCFSRVALQGVRRARIELGEPVVVMGLGPIGLQCIQYAKLCGGFPVVGLDPVSYRREVAGTLGADATCSGGSELSGVGAIMQRGGPAVVIEATGLAQVIPEAFRLCRRNGRVILLGSTRGLADGVNFYTDVHRKGLSVIGVHASTRPKHDSQPGNWTDDVEVELILSLVVAGRVRCRPLITHEFPVARAADAYETLCKAPEALAALLDWTA